MGFHSGGSVLNVQLYRSNTFAFFANQLKHLGIEDGSKDLLWKAVSSD